MHPQIQVNKGICDGISKQTIFAGLFVSVIPSTMDIFGAIILVEYNLPYLSIVVDALLLFIFILLLFLYTNIICPTQSTDVMTSPFWIRKLFSNITHHLYLKCILFLILLASFWSGNCIFTYLATLCDVPSFVGMMKGFVSPCLLFTSWLFGGKEEITMMKVLCILLYAFGEIMIDCGEVSFSKNCLFLAIIAVFCTTGKYFMIEKVMSYKLLNDYDEVMIQYDPYKERANLLSVDTVEIEHIEMIHLNPTIDDECEPSVSSECEALNNEEIDIDDNDNEEDMESISSLLAFGYILPLQIIIGIIVFFNMEYESVLFNKESDSYKSARDPWFWYSRLIQNSFFIIIYWAEFHLVSQFSSVYMMVFGGIRNVSTLILSWILLNYKLTLYGWIGYFVAIVAVSAFQWAKKFDKPQN